MDLVPLLQVFSSFSCTVARKFSVQFSQLLDTLNVFASAQAVVKMSYPGPNGELMLEWVIPHPLFLPVCN